MTVGEYALTFFLVVGTIVAMSIMIRRVLQARIHDTRDYMVDYVAQNTGPHYNGNFYLWYEPYYFNIDSTTDQSGFVRKTLLAGGSSGSSTVMYNQATRIRAASNTAVPKEYLRNLPQR